MSVCVRALHAMCMWVKRSGTRDKLITSIVCSASLAFFALLLRILVFMVGRAPARMRREILAERRRAREG